MKALVLALVASVLAAAFWTLTHVTMQRRKLAVGAAPWLPFALAACAGAALGSGEPLRALPALTALCGAVVAATIDARTGLIPDPLSAAIALVVLGLACSEGTLPTALAGALAAGGTLLTLHLSTRGRGLGLGDVKLGAAIGAGFGPALGIVAIGTAFVTGALYASWLLVTRRARRGDALRFGPFLAIGAFATALVPGGLA